MTVLNKTIHNHKEVSRTTQKSGMLASWFTFSATVLQIMFLELFIGII